MNKSEFLLAPGKIEELVKTNRAPFKIGDFASGKNMKLLYQVPPNISSPKDLDGVYLATGGVYTYVYKNKKRSIGTIYKFTEEQAREVESRIRAQRERVTLDINVPLVEN